MKHIAVLLVGILMSALATAFDECTAELQYDIQASTQALSVSRETELVYEIRQGGLLSVKGQHVDLTDDQRKLAQEYAGNVAALLPQWISLMSRALETAENSVAVAFTVAFGEDSKAAVKSAATLALARERFEQKTMPENGTYSMSASSFNNFEEILGGELEEELENAAMSSIGSLLTEIGAAIMSSEGSLEERMELFGARMEGVGRELEDMGQEIENSASEFCVEVDEVKKLGRRLGKEIPALAPYRIFAS